MGCCKLGGSSFWSQPDNIQHRIQRVHGRGMRTSATFADYRQDIGTDNAPARLTDYFDWYEQAGFDAACVHLHGNIALLAGAKR